MELDEVIILVYFIKIMLLLIFIFINKKCAYFILVNILSCVLFMVFTSFGDINLPKYIFSEVCGLGITIITYILKYERNINRLPIININQSVVNNSINNSTKSENFYVINPDNSLAIAIHN
jgi:hypothetical protein